MEPRTPVMRQLCKLRDHQVARTIIKERVSVSCNLRWMYLPRAMKLVPSLAFFEFGNVAKLVRFWRKRLPGSRLREK